MSENMPAVQGKNEIATFGTGSAFDLLQRQAHMLASSFLVPEQFSILKQDKQTKQYLPKPKQEQDFAVANAAIAIELAGRIDASPIMVAQNLYVVQNRPGWSSQFIIAAINACGKFSPLRFSLTDPEPEESVPVQIVEWQNRQKVTKTIQEKIKNRTCIAWVVERATGERLEGPPVSLKMAAVEGWLSKDGSKWKTMPDVMLRYRAAAFFGRLYAPDLLMGIRSVDEIKDQPIQVVEDGTIIDAETGEIIKASSPVDDLNQKIKEKKSEAKKEKVEAPSESQREVQEEKPAFSLDDPKVQKELAEMNSKGRHELDRWCHVHFNRLAKAYGQAVADLIMSKAQERREAWKAQDIAAPQTIKCPDSGYEIVKSDCDGSDCRLTCEAYKVA